MAFRFFLFSLFVLVPFFSFHSFELTPPVEPIHFIRSLATGIIQTKNGHTRTTQGKPNHFQLSSWLLDFFFLSSTYSTALRARRFQHFSFSSTKPKIKLESAEQGNCSNHEDFSLDPFPARLHQRCAGLYACQQCRGRAGRHPQVHRQAQYEQQERWREQRWRL